MLPCAGLCVALPYMLSPAVVSLPQGEHRATPSRSSGPILSDTKNSASQRTPTSENRERTSPPGWRFGSAPSASVQKDAVARRWYGNKTLTADGIAVGLFASGVVTAPVGSTLGIATFFFGAPLVHVAAGHPDKAAASFGLRALPPLLFIASYGSGCGHDDTGDSDNCPNRALVWMAALGIPAAIAVDAAVIAREDVPQQEDSASVGVTFRVLPSARGSLLSAAGSF